MRATRSDPGAIQEQPIRRLLTAILRVAAFETFIGTLLFASAGRIDLPCFWALLGVHTLLLTASLALGDPTLWRERRRKSPDDRDPHTPRLGTALIVLHLVLAGLDAGRFHWSPAIRAPVRTAALVVFALGMGLSTWATVVNQFFSSAIRIQSDRGHRVIDTGPYRLVRHPGYLGMFLSAPAGGVVLGSLWSLFPMVALAALFVRRLLVEDAMLRRDLPGCADYATRVRFKLLPGLW